MFSGALAFRSEPNILKLPCQTHDGKEPQTSWLGDPTPALLAQSPQRPMVSYHLFPYC